MKRKVIIFLVALCLGTSYSNAQNEVDVLRYSFLDWQGMSSRSAGMAGSFGALGADLSSFSINPAGVGLYRRGDFGITLGISGIANESTYSDDLHNDFSLAAGVHSLGFVSSNITQSSDWKRVNFGVAYNRLATFKEQITATGSMNNRSLLDQFVAQANGTSGDQLYLAFPYDAGLAWDTYLINPIDSTENEYDHVISGQVNQMQVIERSGNLAETAFAVGANYKDRLYLGGALAFPRINYTEESRYTEYTTEEDLELDHFTFAETFNVSGSGFNAKLGAIFKTTDWLRVGVSGQTPTWFSITESFSRDMTSVFKGEAPYEASTDIVANYYRIRTTYRLGGSAAFVLGKAGVVNADYEFVNYATGKLGNTRNVLSSYDFTAENQAISAIYRPAHNVRIGTEFRIGKPFRIRAGVGYQQSAYVNGAVTDNPAVFTYAGGLGYRGLHFYADISYTQKQEFSEYYMFNPDLVEPIKIKSGTGQFLMSCGFRF